MLHICNHMINRVTAATTNTDDFNQRTTHFTKIVIYRLKHNYLFSVSADKLSAY